jgi:hypothetical protein
MSEKAESRYFLSVFDDPGFQTTEKKIQSFKDLEAGWSYGEGEPFESSVLNTAIQFNRYAFRRGFFETDAFPGLNGEVLLTIYLGRYYLEFTFEQDGSVTYYHEEAQEEVCYEEGLLLEDAQNRLETFRKQVWKESESSIQYITIRADTDSRVQLSRTLEGMTQESRSLAESVSERLDEASAVTSENTTQGLRSSGLFSGVSQQKYYQMATG